MRNWKTISLFVCVYAFTRELRPIEPFYSAYMTSPAVNLTLEQMTADIYSLGSYSCFVLVIIVFLVTDYLRYKPILIIDGLCGLMTYCNIVGHPSILRLQLGQIFYGFVFSSEIAYFGYLYAMTDDKLYYQRITGQARAACLAGKFFSSLFAQSVSLINGSIPYIQLVYLSIFGTLFSTVWAFLMPTVTNSVYFHNQNPDSMYQSTQSIENNIPDESSTSQERKTPVAIIFENKKTEEEKKSSHVLLYIWNDFRRSYSDPYVVKLCFWWAFAFGAYVQVYSYIGVLYIYILNLNEDTEFTSYNGAAESLNTLFGAIAAYAIGKLDLNWYKIGDLFFGIGSILIGAVLFGCFYMRIIWFIYTFYIIYGCLYQTMLTVAESEVAKRLSRDSYGLVFGFNSFIGLFIQMLITYGIIERHFITVTTIQQFLIYAIYYFILGALFLIFSVKSYLLNATDSLVECNL